MFNQRNYQLNTCNQATDRFGSIAVVTLPDYMGISLSWDYGRAHHQRPFGRV